MSRTVRLDDAACAARLARPAALAAPLVLCAAVAGWLASSCSDTSHVITRAPAASPSVQAGTKPVAWRERFSGPLSEWHSPSGHAPSTLTLVYGLQQDQDEQFLHARHDALARPGHFVPPAVHWGKGFRDDAPLLTSACVLRWRWRVLQHPAVADDPWQDVAASLYVVIRPPGLLVGGHGFKFGWLAKPGPAGTDQRGLLQVALRHDPASPAWRSERVDLCARYRVRYGDPGEERIRYIGVVTDADSSESVAEADYDEFVLEGR